MLITNPFYYNTIRNTIAAFGNLFNEIFIDQNGTIIQVPIQFLPKEKFVQRSNYRPGELDDQTVKVETTLPAMGFDLAGINYDTGRKLNKTLKIHDPDTDTYMYNRTPFVLSLNLYIGTRKIDESLRIVEQILPYFTPELVVKIKDKDDFNVSTNVSFVMEDATPEIIYDGDFDERRSVLWTLSFTSQIYLYPDVKTSSVIRRTIVDINELETGEIMSQVVTELNPFDATADSDYDIDVFINDKDNLYDPLA